MEAKMFKPLGDRVVVELVEATEKKSTSGILIPETANMDDYKTGIVVAVGKGLYTPNGFLIRPSVKVGDKVVLPAYDQGSTPIKAGDKTYQIYREGELIAVLDEKDKTPRPGDQLLLFS